MQTFSRRSFLRTATTAAAIAPVLAATRPAYAVPVNFGPATTSSATTGSATTGAATTGALATASGSTAQFVGHKPGRIYIGLCGNGFDISSKTGPVGLRRTFYRWSDASREDKAIAADHAAGRMPWISFKPPGDPAIYWKKIGDGLYDADIRARARRYAKLTHPVVVTFNHEPHTDKTGDPAQFSRAWCRIHDVMKSETGLKNVISAPIAGEWTFSPINRRMEPEWWMTEAVLSRCHFMGLDLYHNKTGQTYATRLSNVLDWLDNRGHNNLMVGMGETGATDDFTNISGAAWWSASWSYMASRTDRLWAASYFNRNDLAMNNWLLTQSSAKLTAFTATVRSSLATAL